MPESKKVALVTGANRGIGLETVRQLAAQGIEVFLGARTLQSAQQAAAELKASGAEGVHPIQLDVTKASDRIAAAEQIGSQFGHLDILINNAALGAPEGTLLVKLTSDTPEKELQDVFNTNVFSVLLLTHDLLPLLRKSDAGRIVNVSSTTGSLTMQANLDPMLAYTKRFAYNASKSALNMFTIHLAQELAETNIKVNSILPGWVKTELGTNLAPMSVEDGAKTSVQAALLDADGANGSFFHLGQQLPW
ncbi:MAG: SDR family NAD(P)-dependent oxidoreductase [Janthinobacterium lividum]